MSDKLKDTIGIFHEHGISYETKTIKIFGDIDKDMKDRTISNLHLADQKSGEVTILLSSEGGDVGAGLAIYDAIRAMQNRVRIICYEGVESMASVILQAADKGGRLMMPNSYLMLHEGESSLSGKQKDMDEQKKLHDWQEKRCMDIYWEKISENNKVNKKRFTKKRLNANMDKDWNILPHEAIEIGLADKVLETYS